MIQAKNNIIVKIDTANQYAILNPISGSFDLMGQQEYDAIKKFETGLLPDTALSDYLLERGYAFNSAAEQDAAIEKAYAAFKEESASAQVQLMLVPTYGCNLACTYCFQQGIDEKPALISKETVDAFFDYAQKNFSDTKQKPFVTLFGGEPLVNSPAQRSIIGYIAEKCAQAGYEIAAVTNGYDFTEYVDVLQKTKIKEIQFTLDGSRTVHDSRRATTNRKGTFDKVVAGIEAAVKNGIPVNLRSVVDLENIEDMVNLAEFLNAKGWLDLPPELFKTQIGRNYELFECSAKPQHLLSEVELWGRVSALEKKHPVLEKFHRPDFKGIRHIVDTAEMYMASFDTCPACKTEWVFDLYGNIYGCTASCGREEYLLGTYWPEVDLNTKAIETWQRRDVTAIDECKDCKYDVICGGGCGVVAANRHDGNPLNPDCRPIQELLQIGATHYKDDLFAMSEDAGEPAAACDCGGAPGTAHTSGCIICGQELVYSDTPSEAVCMVCGKTRPAYVSCPAGHYVCDSCHSADILTQAQNLLIGSTEKDPVALAAKIFELPALKMHGPEYHSLVPAVLVAASQNASGARDVLKIKEAVARGRDFKGASCGLYGVCGAAAGAGIAYSVLSGATSMKGAERSRANEIAGKALIAVSRNVGPRCCKRESVTAIRAFCENTEYFSGVKHTDYLCSQAAQNKDCIGKACPFFRADLKNKKVGIQVAV